MGRLVVLLILLGMAVPATAEETVVLDFKLAMEVRDGETTRHIEIHPKVAVKDRVPAAITIESSDSHHITLDIDPRLSPTGLVELKLRVKARLGQTMLVRKIKLVTLQGVPAIAEIEDERTREMLKVEVLATKGPPSQ